MNKQDQNSLSYRKDHRTQDQFKKDLKRDTEYEKIAALAIKTHLVNTNKKVIVQNYGMDNSGDVVTDSKKVNAQPDYLFIIDGVKHLYEIKVHSDRYPCMTFKVSNIRSYIKSKAECIVVTESGYYIFDEGAMKYMTKHCTPSSYKGFAGGKRAYRLMKTEISTLIFAGVVTKVNWGSPTIDLLDQYRYIFQR